MAPYEEEALQRKSLSSHGRDEECLDKGKHLDLGLACLSIDNDGDHDDDDHQWVVHEQNQSPFFQKLPLEVRQNIYHQLWLSAGITQHIYQAGNSRLAELSHATCITNPDARDLRDEVVARRCRDEYDDDPGDIDAAYDEILDEPGETLDDWVIRLFSDWCNHFRCEEQPERPNLPSERAKRQLEGSSDQDEKPNKKVPARTPVFFFSPFLAPLLACRRMATEARQSMYENVTFSFIGSAAMRRFLETTSPDLLAQTRSLHFIWRAPTDAYRYDGEDPDNPENRHLVSALNDWTSLWQTALKSLPRLKELRIWAYPVHTRFPMPKPAWLRPWWAFGHLKLHTFTVKLLWDLDDPIEAEETLAFLEDAPFDVSREPAMYHDPSTWRMLRVRASRARDVLRRNARGRLAARVAKLVGTL